VTQPRNAVPRRIRYHYARPGRSVTVYDEWLLIDRPDTKVLLLEGHTGKPFAVNGAVVLDTGAPILWFVFPGQWFDVGRFHRRDGTFTGWYTNLTTPAVIDAPEDWSCTDLFLDLWTPAMGSSAWLDEPEFAEAIEHAVIDQATAGRVAEERTRIEARLAAKDWPPPIARQTDLAHARMLLTPK
jgi:predicted RNA-binding protein associated with RNAse of E/G family